MNSAWEGAGDSLITRAKEWRAAAEDILAAEDFDATVEFTVTGVSPAPGRVHYTGGCQVR